MIHAFDGFELDEERNELRRDGEAVDILPTPLRLLRYLVANRDRAIPKVELLDAIWPDTVVSETALSSALKQLRKTLGDDGASQRFIRTRRGHGYRFVPEVEERADWAEPPGTALVVDEPAAAAPRPRRPTQGSADPRFDSSRPLPPQPLRPRREPGWFERLAPLDRVLVALGVPLFLFCYTLHVQTAWNGNGWASVLIQPDDTGGYPTVARMAPFMRVEESGLRVGDTVLGVGPYDLRGVGSLEYYLRFVEAVGTRGSVEMTVERQGERHVLDVPAPRLTTQIPALPVAPAFLLAGLVLLLRAPREEASRAGFHACLATALMHGSLIFGAPWETALYLVVFNAAGSVTFPLVLRFLSIFPHGNRPSPWFWHGVWVFAFLMGVLLPATLNGIPFVSPAPEPGLFLVNAIGIGICMATFSRSYRRSTPVEQRQLKLVAYAVYVAGFPLLVTTLLALFRPTEYGQWPLYAFAGLILPPVALFFAIGRYNLFDIDRLFSTTVSYNAVLVAFVAAALVVVPRVAAATSAAVGLDATTGQIALSLALAALVVPAQRVLRPRIEGAFFRSRHEFDVGVAELLGELSTSTDAATLATRVGEGLTRLARPQTCVLYALRGEVYTALFAEGPAVPPALPADSPLVVTLRARGEPLVLNDQSTPRSADAALDPFDRAVLETLGAHVVLPIEREGALVVILCLGPKRSGDVYTPTDVALLASVAHTVSLALERFDQAELARDARKLEESVRRYVPGAIMQELQSGTDLESRVSAVSVLFVDIRGHTPFSEKRDAGEVFEAINRYTQEVSKVVSEHGGSIVEFNGDGMMVVFGAPRELAQKEAAAVSAGLAILERVSTMEVGGERIQVGVGIATGSAFVGNVQAADRLIWTALGDTTNLAARLEGLTRELAAAMVIDLATRRAAGACAASFELHEQVPIRGRSKAEDLYVLPLAS